jgi:hypothetical protein
MDPMKNFFTTLLTMILLCSCGSPAKAVHFNQTLYVQMIDPSVVTTENGWRIITQTLSQDGITVTTGALSDGPVTVTDDGGTVFELKPNQVAFIGGKIHIANVKGFAFVLEDSKPRLLWWYQDGTFLSDAQLGHLSQLSQDIFVNKHILVHGALIPTGTCEGEVTQTIMRMEHGLGLDYLIEGDDPVVLITISMDALRFCWLSYGLESEVFLDEAMKASQPVYERDGFVAGLNAFLEYLTTADISTSHPAK